MKTHHLFASIVAVGVCAGAACSSSKSDSAGGSPTPAPGGSAAAAPAEGAPAGEGAPAEGAGAPPSTVGAVDAEHTAKMHAKLQGKWSFSSDPQQLVAMREQAKTIANGDEKKFAELVKEAEQNISTMGLEFTKDHMITTRGPVVVADEKYEVVRADGNAIVLRIVRMNQNITMMLPEDDKLVMGPTEMRRKK